MTTIVLVGDSVLDNSYWLDDKTSDITQQLNTLTDYQVHNIAVDESVTKDILNGVIPKDHYVSSRTYPYPVGDDGKVYPLTLLKDLGSQDTFTVLSIGGNDSRGNLQTMLFGPDAMWNQLMNVHGLSKLYPEVVDRITQITPKTVLVIFYYPFRGSENGQTNIFASFWQPITILMDRWRKFVVNIAAEKKLPIIDLSQTFNPDDRSHYGKTHIESSNKSGLVIAKLIKHVVNTHDFSGPSRLYKTKIP